jgi:hypothetical protein
MKKTNIITLISVAVIALTVFVVFSSCNKEKENTDNKNQKSLQIEDINEISSEIAKFHTFAMKKFLTEIYSENDILDDNSVEKMVIFFKNEMINYDFKYIKLNKDNMDFSEILSLENIETMISFSENSYDFSTLNLNLSNANSSELAIYLATLNTALIKTKCSNIDVNVPNLIINSENFEEFRLNYLDFVENELSDIQTNDEYMYIRFFADVYLSSIEYVPEFLFKDNSKGKFWDMLKEAWEIAKPIVAADASGAVAGAMVGAVTGPGIVATGMAGACGSSAGYCVGQLIGGK